MEHIVYRESDMNISKWTGGTTKQLAIYPKDGNYLERSFIYRLSTATCEKEESNFSKLLDFNRVLMVLEGEVVLAHQDERVARLKQYEQDRFDGAFKTKSFGKITDYNLMTLKGNEGFLTYIPLTNEPTPVVLNKAGSFQKNSFCFYCAKGYAVVTLNDEPIMLKEGEQLVIDGETDEKYVMKVMGEGALVQAEIYYNETKDEFAPTVIPKEPVCMDDWKQCLYLANSQFRGASFFFKRKKDEWLDEELGKVVNILEKTCVTMLVYIIGLSVIILSGYKTLTDGQLVGLAFLWIIVESVVVSPLIYLPFVPKPVRKHIKKISELTPYEQKVRQRQQEFNPRLQRIMDNTVTGNKNFTGAKLIYKEKDKE
ncbi:MAG: HutD family protein [Clostridia bacterium]|nr:HutD family protein [Clostridia bacterium]